MLDKLTSFYGNLKKIQKAISVKFWFVKLGWSFLFSSNDGLYFSSSSGN